MEDRFKDDYNLDALKRVHPAGDAFDMWVTPRYVETYTSGYETLSSRVIKARTASKDLFVDIGAHYGYYTLLAAHANPAARVIVVEPVEENVAVLRKNLALNEVDDERAILLHAAASAEKGTATLCKSEASDNSSLYPHPASATLARVPVETVSVDDLLAAHSARHLLIKMDTDGHELAVLQGGEETLSTIEDVSILLEMNPKMLKLAGTCPEDVLAHLVQRGFRAWAIDDVESRFYPLDDPANVRMLNTRFAQSYYNVLCERRTSALHVLFFSHSSDLSGAARSLLDVVDGLSRHGVLCTTVLPDRGAMREQLVAAGSAVVIPGEVACTAHGWWWVSVDESRPWTALEAQHMNVRDTLLPEIARIAPDVIYSQTVVSPWGAYCAEQWGLPHVLSAREYGQRDYGFTFLPDFRECLDALYDSSDAVCCITGDVQCTLFPEDRAGKTQVIYSGVVDIRETSMLSPERPKRSDSPRIGLLATITPGKGQMDLIRAGLLLAEQGHHVTCVLAGYTADTAYVRALKDAVEDSGYADRFEWPGFVKEPKEILETLDVLVSASRFEALGRSLIEAMRCGIPVIYANTGGPKELYEDRAHGLAYPPGDHEALAHALVEVLNNPAEAQTRATAARDYVLKVFNRDVYVNRIESILRRSARTDKKSAGREFPVTRLLYRCLPESHVRTIFVPMLYYADQDESFAVERSVKGTPTGFGLFILSFTLPGSGHVRLRLDPVYGEAVVFRIDEWSVLGADGSRIDPDIIQWHASGDPCGNQAWRFCMGDASLEISAPCRVKRIEIAGYIKRIPPPNVARHAVAEAARYAAALNERDDMSRYAASLKERMAAMEASASWRWTAPLRDLVRRLNNVSRGPSDPPPVDSFGG